MSGSGISWAICKSASRSRQTTTLASHHSVFTGRMPFLPPNQQRQSTEGRESKEQDGLKYLQWTTVGSTMPVRHCRTLTTKSRKSELSSGTPWSGQAMYCICFTIRSSVPDDYKHHTTTPWWTGIEDFAPGAQCAANITQWSGHAVYRVAQKVVIFQHTISQLHKKHNRFFIPRNSRNTLVKSVSFNLEQFQRYGVLKNVQLFQLYVKRY